MAWVENEVWQMEQGVDARMELRAYEDDAALKAYPMTGWQFFGMVADAKKTETYPIDYSQSDPENGILVAILPEASVNQLKVGKEYFYDFLAVAPGAGVADDVHIGFGAAVPLFRPARRVP